MDHLATENIEHVHLFWTVKLDFLLKQYRFKVHFHQVNNFYLADSF